MFQSLLFVCLSLFFQTNFIIAIRYNTISEAYVRHVSPLSRVSDKTCLLEPEEGPCRASLTMFYYDPKKKNCSTFVWGGCQGNGNRFDSQSECLSKCLTSSNLRSRPNFCSLTFDYGFCFGELKRWYYDPVWRVCKERIYSGCGGNQNNFYNQQQCNNICNYANQRWSGLSTQDDSNFIQKQLIINPSRGKN